jgi:hypothetical protein
MSTTAPQRPPVEQPSDTGDRIVFWIIGGVAVLLAIVGIVTYSSNQETEEARQLAAELTQKFEAAGLDTPESQLVFVRAFGDDGGAVCDNPANALGRALLYDQLGNGASFVGRRPVIADRRLITAGALILETYCPEELQEFRDKFDDLKTDDVIGN